VQSISAPAFVPCRALAGTEWPTTNAKSTIPKTISEDLILCSFVT